MTPDQLAQLLDEIGKRLGPAGDYVFRIAVQRVVVGAVMSTVLGIVLIVGSTYIALRVRRWIMKPDMDSDAGSDAEIIVVFGGIVLLLATGVGVILVYTGVLSLLTAEYTALRDILSAIGGAK